MSDKLDPAFEGRVRELVDDRLITAYAYSNLERAILTTLLVERIMREDDRQRALQEHYGTVREHLYLAKYSPPDEPHTEDIRLAALRLAADLFRDVESRLVRAGIISEKKLRVLD